MEDANERIDGEAANWLVKSKAEDFADWDQLAEWMAQSPEHGAAFNALCALDAEIAEHSSNLQTRAANDVAPTPRRPEGAARWRWPVGGLIAASVVAAVAFLSTAGQDKIYETAAGETMQIALDDGARAVLNGSTRLEVQSDDRRTVSVAHGEVTFSVIDGTGRAMQVSAGKVQLRDIGTIFNVIHTPNMTQVAVSQGSVAVAGAAPKFIVHHGNAARFEKDNPRPDLFTLPADAVAGWQSGRLMFRNASLDEVAAAVSRRTGIPVVLAPSLEDRRFTGVLTIPVDHQSAKSIVEQMLGVGISTTAQGWTMDAASRN